MLTPAPAAPVAHSFFPLLELPSDILPMILVRLDDIQTLVSALATSRALYGAFLTSAAEIVRAIFTRAYASIQAQSYAIGRVFWQLKLAVIRNVIPRSAVEEAFEMAWPIFEDRELEEIILPHAWALARSYWTEDRAEDALRFLGNIFYCKAPFSCSKSRRVSPTFLPLWRMLYELAEEEDQPQILKEIRQGETLRELIQPATLYISREEIALDAGQRKNPFSVTVYFSPRLPCIFGHDGREVSKGL